MALPTPPLRLVDSATVRQLSSRDLNDEEFYDRFSPYVARIGMRLLGRSADVDDLVQEVFIAAYKKRDQLPDEGATRGWLAVVSVRTARRMLRAAAHVHLQSEMDGG